MSSLTAKKTNNRFDGNERVVKHKRWRDAFQEVIFQMTHGKGFELIILVGPTGSGKSTLIDQLLKYVWEQERPEMEKDPDYCPVVKTNAISDGYRSFSWKRLFGDAGAAAGDPFARLLRKRDAAAADFYSRSGEPRTIANIRIAMEYEFRYRRTKYWIIDEAAHILSGAKSGDIGDQLDVLKSIAQAGDVKIILAGPYSLASYINCSAQLARRGAMVHLPRYIRSDRKDLGEFASCAKTILDLFGLDDYPCVRENLNFYYAGSAGCIGILKDWCDRAVAAAQQDRGRRSLTIEDFRATRLSRAALMKIWQELMEGEALFVESDDEEIEGLEQLALSERKTSRPFVPAPKNNVRSGIKPGTRKPIRDAVSPLANA